MMQDLQECVRCLYKSNHPLGITFDAEGICSGCRVHEEKDNLNWSDRKEKLRELLSSYRVKGRNNYDCIIPVSGGQDSFFIVHTIISEFGLNPLLVNFNRNFNSGVGLRNLAVLRQSFLADFRQVTINPKVARKVVKTSLVNLGTLNWLWIAGQTSLPVRLANEMGVPLVIWGAHQGLEQVGMYSHLDEVEMTARYRKEHDLLGVDEKDIFRFDPDFSERDITQLAYPPDEVLADSNVRGIYLGNFIRWDTVQQHKEMIEKYGYKGAKQNRTYYQYDNPDCPVYSNFQDILKQKKFGYSKVTDQLSRDIRHGRISRDKAIKINQKFIERAPLNIVEFANWLGITPAGLSLPLLNLTHDFAEEIILDRWRTALDIKLPLSSRYMKRKNAEIDLDFTNIGKGISFKD